VGAPLSNETSEENMTETRAGYLGPPREELWIGQDVTCTQANVFSNQNTTLVYPYETPLEALILSMATANPDSKTRPFLQRIQLQGPKGAIVRATGQVDDGAMRNCISKTRWERYGHCLEPMEPSSTWIKVANDARIKSLGRWIGKVTVGGTEAESVFEVFDCKGAFDVILGKPWLRKVRAIHDYFTDIITIGTDTHQEALVNSIPLQSPPSLMPIEITIATNEQVLEHPEEQEQEPKQLEHQPLDSETHSHRSWVPQLEYEEQKRQRLLAQARREHEHYKMLRGAHDRATKARNAATKRNNQRANNEDSENQLKAEWTRIQLLQISDDPWTETWWATFLNLKETRDHNLDRQKWY